MYHFSQKVPSTTAPQTTSDSLLIAQTAIPFGMAGLYILFLIMPRFMGGANIHISTVMCVWASFLAMLASVGLAIYNLIERKKQTFKEKKIFMSAAIGTGSISFLLLVVSYWVLLKSKTAYGYARMRKDYKRNEWGLGPVKSNGLRQIIKGNLNIRKSIAGLQNYNTLEAANEALNKYGF